MKLRLGKYIAYKTHQLNEMAYFDNLTPFSAHLPIIWFLDFMVLIQRNTIYLKFYIGYVENKCNL